MLKTTTKLLAMGLLLVSAAGCKTMYKPTMQNVPLLSEQGDFKAVVNTSNVQAAYAVTDKVGVMANGYFRNNKWNAEAGSTNWDYTNKWFNGEAAVGYYVPFSDEGRFEVYGGAGYGRVTYEREFTDQMSEPYYDKFSANNMRFFIQPNIGRSTENFEFAFSTRLVGLQFNNVSQTGYTQEELEFENLTGLDQSIHAFIEPGITIRGGYKWIKLHSQVIFSQKLTSTDINYNPFNMNFGIQIDLSKKYRN
ncbi:MAG: hypothetical protein LPK19_11330 [Hymenobacteraceae bacterium]|nr:hypothetical protein [Hymenobacteraceae bacterium]MDX5396820.1 hypothetical protein [Hymenobacteraceae bacterium]MDX5512888.1 hypothetical protein [Hymenobacteraceae bacterium]